MKWLIGGVLVVLLAFTGCHSFGEKKRDFTPTTARFFLESTEANAPTVALPISGLKVAISASPVLTEGELSRVEIVQVELGRCLLFQTTPYSVNELYRVTGANQGRRLVLMLNQLPMGSRRIEGPMADGRLLIFVEVADAALPELVTNMNKTIQELQHAKKK